jgi:hypothetical protein
METIIDRHQICMKNLSGLLYLPLLVNLLAWKKSPYGRKFEVSIFDRICQTRLMHRTIVSALPDLSFSLQSPPLISASSLDF